MMIQISSGQGPIECELAVGKFLEALEKEILDLKVVHLVKGNKTGCYKSVMVESKRDLSYLEGSVKWICQSPFRPEHKRKNWFIDISICGERKELELDENMVRFETFRSGGKGGQHVNKVETGVRVIHIPTGMSTVSTKARSQHMNKKIAMNNLCNMILEQNEVGKSALKASLWMEHMRLERGNEVRIYEGMNFILR